MNPGYNGLECFAIGRINGFGSEFMGSTYNNVLCWLMDI